ncbi:MAG: carbohydrate binding domain-containing protein, partial [Acidobacteriota bacterium]
FEDNLTHQTGANFGWQVTTSGQAQIGVDTSHGHESDRSLRILFQVRTKLEAVDISQLVLVAPSTQYELEFYVKTQKVESAETPAVAIFDATDGTALASSASAPAGSNDWERVTISFKTGARTEAVTLRLVRGSCGTDTPCPIFGTVWYDDFTLKSSR